MDRALTQPAPLNLGGGKLFDARRIGLLCWPEKMEYASRKWFTAIPLHYREGEEFWDRDAGLFCKGFRALGVDSKFVALGTPCVRTDRPLILSSLEQMRDPAFWASHNLEGVVLYSWALPQYTGITRALKKAGAKVVLPMDGDGTRSAREWFTRVLSVNYVYARMNRRLLPGPFALAQTFASLLKFRHRGTLEHMSLMDLLAAQSPLALQRFSRFFSGADRPDLIDKLFLLEHPIGTHMVYDPAVPKERLIIAAGGWERLVKGAPLLVESIACALTRNPLYRARIIGSGEESLRRLASALPEQVRSRIEITGPIPNLEIAGHYQKSQIILNTSYSEGFSLAIAEGLCCGCSAVGSALMSCMNYFCSVSSGTLATRRTAAFFQDALCAEMDAWCTGRRDPVLISKFWTERLHATEVARRTLEIADSMSQDTVRTL